MELGQRIKRARLERGMSQRQLCGDRITRNMLSLIESGKANPAMDTLQYLAARLGVGVSLLLGETDAPTDPNDGYMVLARQAYQDGRPLPDGYQGPDSRHDAEYTLLQTLSATRQAENALRSGKVMEARQYLQKAELAAAKCPYDTAANAQHRQNLRSLLI